MTRQSYEELLNHKENKMEGKDIQEREKSSILQQGTLKLSFLQKQQIHDDHQLNNNNEMKYDSNTTHNNNKNWRTVSFKKRPITKEEKKVVTM